MSPHVQVEKLLQGKKIKLASGFRNVFSPVFLFLIVHHLSFLTVNLILLLLESRGVHHRLQQEQSVLQMFLPSASFPPLLLIVIKHNEESIRNNILLLMDKPSILVLEPWECVNSGKPSGKHPKSKTPLWTTVSTLFSCFSYWSSVTSWAATPAPNHCWDHRLGPQPCQALAGRKQSQGAASTENKQRRCCFYSSSPKEAQSFSGDFCGEHLWI